MAKKMATISALLLLATLQLGDGRLIREVVVGAAETCEPTYGFLPCSSNVWGLLFLVVVFEILLTFAGRYVGMGSEIFFRTIGPGIIGGSLFQFLGTIPQIVMILATVLSGSKEAAQQRATLGMGLVAGSTVMTLTLIWGVAVVLASYDLSSAPTIDKSGTQKTTPEGHGVVTDVETSYTARIMLIPLIPFLILLLAAAFSSSSVKRVFLLIALIVSVMLLFGFILYQAFRPWIQARRFEYLMSKYAKDKLLRLLSRNGRPDATKIQRLFSQIDRDRSTSVSAAELRVLLLGVRMDEGDFSTDRDVENILESFDTTGDGRINREEFVVGMTKLLNELAKERLNRIKKSRSSNDPLQQGLLDDSDSPNESTSRRDLITWLNYLKALSLVIFGIALMLSFAEPLITTVVGFATAANLPNFSVSYFAIPLAMNYRVAVQAFTSSRTKTQNSISLTLSALYSGVYMNNVVSLIVFLAPVYALNLSTDVFVEVLVVIVMNTVMVALTGFRTSFPRWLGYVVVLLYPVTLAATYLLTDVLGLP
ncbi:sodium/calcium exchanger NCL2-like [Salvia divinorum]|uniref:Sodium/calcium exchanger NCL2-like n=1 Tax=Salvia divinorum TaxID=28513 RepID=A0ABD1G136_SALDI